MRNKSLPLFLMLATAVSAAAADNTAARVDKAVATFNSMTGAGEGIRQLPHVLEFLGGNDLDSSYRTLETADFSNEVLTPLAHRLFMARDTGSGWADLGNPHRVIGTLVRNRIEPTWLSDTTSVEWGDESFSFDAPRRGSVATSLPLPCGLPHPGKWTAKCSR
jgi:hypothetical protein